MLNLDKSIRILEFDKIRKLLASKALTDGAKTRALSLMPSSNFEYVKKNLVTTYT